MVLLSVLESMQTQPAQPPSGWIAHLFLPYHIVYPKRTKASSPQCGGLALVVGKINS
jgi:hypothetical protein